MFYLNRDINFFILDSKYYVSMEFRKPALNFQTFLRIRKDLLESNMRQTRTMFPNQDFEGSVLKDGFNILLGSNAKWKNGIILLNEQT